MAGANNVRFDPALQKYYEANKYRYKYFRWTPRTAWITFVYAGLVPSILLYVGYKADGKYEFRGKRRGDIISEW
ncbi:hypothetical protein VTO42DRAFT_1772 [Malbranchea cinnamomea]